MEGERLAALAALGQMALDLGRALGVETVLDVVGNQK
jgi:hypothetical protein